MKLKTVCLLPDWVFILFRWSAGYGSLIQPSYRSPSFSSPPKTIRPSFPCSTRRQPRRVLPTGRKVLPHPVGPVGDPEVGIPQPCGPFLIVLPEAELSLSNPRGYLAAGPTDLRTIESKKKCEKSTRLWSPFRPRLRSSKRLLSATRESWGGAYTYG